jgi:hypothetical protein
MGETTYKLSCLCLNCNSKFDINVPKGISVKVGNDWKTLWIGDDAGKSELVKCVNCGCFDTRKDFQ